MRVSRVMVLVWSVVAAAGAGALERQPTGEYHQRRLALGQRLQGGAALIFAADEPAAEWLSYRQDEDFYYLTGWNEPGAALLVEAAEAPAAAGGPAAAPYREILFLPTRNLVLEQYTGVKLDAQTAGAAGIAGVDEVRPLTELVPELNRLIRGSGRAMSRTRAANVATATDDAKARSTVEVVSASLGTTLPPQRDLRELTMGLRSTKSAGEIALLRKASDASVSAQQALFGAVKPGASERTVSGLIDYKLKEGGCERPSYPSIVGSGKNSTVLHYSEDDQTMVAGEVVVIDAAGEYSMYANDITRTLPVSGHFSPRQREIYEIVLGAQRAAAAAFVSGRSTMYGEEGRSPDPAGAVGSLQRAAYDYINTHGKDLHGQPLGKYFLHGLGHSVGIDVHDPYDYKKPFGPGSVFTIEPGIYIAEEKIGVRIEDTFYVDEGGKLIDLTAALPHTADEVEAAMSAAATGKGAGKRRPQF